MKVEISHQLLFGILTPRQAAYLKFKVEMLLPVHFWTDWMLVFYQAIAVDEYNR